MAAPRGWGARPLVIGLVVEQNIDSPNSKGRIGWGAQADWDQTLNILKQYRELKTDQPWTAFHTNDFLPK